MRQLYHNLMDYEGINVFEDVLQPVMHLIKDTITECAVLKSFDVNVSEDDIYPELEAFFALSVCNDYLISTPLLISQQQYVDFFEGIGFEVDWYKDTFNPVLHEIVSIYITNKHDFKQYHAQNGEIHSKVNSLYYPILRFGDLIFSRGGCSITCTNGTSIVENFATENTLYFTNHRYKRACSDLSHGWGSNSRWRTSFERFYELEDCYLLNVDGEYDIGSENGFKQATKDESITLKEAKELLLHRSLVSTEDKGLFPFEWRLAVKKESDFWLNPTALSL